MKQYLSSTALVAVLLVLDFSVYGTSASAQISDTTATTTASTPTDVPPGRSPEIPPPATAPTPASSTVNSARIAELVAQIKKLSELLATLRTQMSSTTGQIQSLTGELRLGLKLGMTGEDIKLVQEALASDPAIYPAGLMTGYFGPMTIEAIKRFQTKNNLEVTGEINAETKAALDTVLEARRAEGRFPVGLLLNPGMKQKFEERVRTTCAISPLMPVNLAPQSCVGMREKYKFEIDDKGQIKIKSEIKQDDEDKLDDEDDSDDADESDEDDN